jgi:hypothetical protein
MAREGLYGTNEVRPAFKVNPDQIIMTPDPYAGREPEFYVGIFNVSQKEYRISKPWVVGGQVKIAACDQDKLYSKPFILRDIEHLLRAEVGREEITPIPTKGILLAQDVVNSNDPQGDWRSVRPLDAHATNEGNNYYELGLFWVKLATPDAEPDEEAVEMAIKRMEATYNRRIEEAEKFYAGGPEAQKQIEAPNHEAADYFGIDRPWHHQMTRDRCSRLKKADKVAQAKE